MPKIKNLFTSGKMNKDLDERLIPNNQYRDALNIQVANSEGSDVGAIENILGNSPLFANSYNSITNTKTYYSSQDYGISDSPKTIGSIKDSRNEKIYWFVTSNSTDAIIEYDQTTDVVSPIVVDKNGVLNFSKDKLITGINIIGELLFFTDDNSEPKCVNITRFKEASASSSNGFANHTEIYGRDFLEQDITVIKKSPLTAPLIEARDSKRSGVGVGLSPLTVTRNFGYPIAVDSTVTLTFSSAPDYKIGDILILSATHTVNNVDSSYELLAEIQSGTNSFTNTNIKFLSVPGDVPEVDLTWEVVLKEDEPIFQYRFPRFAYRWKYNDGQYSAFSPFSQIAFIPGEFEYLSIDGYNNGMVNNIRSLRVYGLQSPPPDVVEVEILFKESNNNLVYAVDTVELSNQELEIESDLIYKVIEGNQILRPWDNVPRLAKAQEMIGNRIVYANYLQNFNIENKLESNFYIDSLPHTNVKNPEESIKSLRNYQLGVVWKDQYGRETPVFTNQNSAITLGGVASNKKNTLKASISSTPPSFATHFKYFIKETSNEYYNLALDRYYLAEDGNVWLSFPSSERNKVDEETYLYLKKQHGGDNYIKEAPKYKILDISNEAPEFLTKSNSPVASAAVTAIATNPPNLSVTTIEFAGPAQNDNQDFYTKLVPGNLISIRYNSQDTRDYKIVSGGATGSATNFKIVLSETIKDTNVFPNNTSPVPNGGTFYINVKEQENNKSEEFVGRFFVKINRDTYFNNNIINSFKTTSIEYVERAGSTIPAAIANTGPGSTAGGYFGFTDPNAIETTWQNKIKAPEANSNWFGIGWAEYLGGNVDPIDPGKPTHPILDDYLPKKGTVVKFQNTNNNFSEEYRITDATVYYDRRGFKRSSGADYIVNGNARKSVRCELDRAFETGFGTVNGILILEEITVEGNTTLSSENPAIFETEPKETAELDIYYEASDAYPVSEASSVKSLPWFNCYSFGNGVESDRIRDDYNAIRIGKGVKVSAVLDEPYAEERRDSSFIFSQIFNTTSGVNRLNQFIQALPITKDLSPAYGSIQKLHARDTDLIALCEDKCFKILANKDALFNADGNVNVTSNNNVLGQAIPYVGEFGISKNPESFASYGFRAYFADKNRGVVLRLSRNGLEEISEQGMSNYIADKLASATHVIGSYDDYSDCYNVSFSDETLTYKQGVEGWPTRKSFVPESALSLNNIYYTFKGSQIWSHNNEIRNNFYGTQYNSSVEIIFNASPSEPKNFKTISYEGSEGWTTPSIESDMQNGSVPSYIKKEGIYYNFIKGTADTWNNTLQSGTIDTAEFSVQGIDTVASISGDTVRTEFTLTVSENND